MSNSQLYPLEYRLTRCLRCARKLSDHKRLTLSAILATAGANFDKPVNGYRSPVSLLCVGQWEWCDPMLWPEAKAAGVTVA